MGHIKKKIIVFVVIAVGEQGKGGWFQSISHWVCSWAKITLKDSKPSPDLKLRWGERKHPHTTRPYMHCTAQTQNAIRLTKLNDDRLVSLQGSLNSLFLLIRDSIILITILYTHTDSFICRAQKDFTSVGSSLSPFQRLENEAFSHLYKQEVLSQLFKNYLVPQDFKSPKIQLQLASPINANCQVNPRTWQPVPKSPDFYIEFLAIAFSNIFPIYHNKE